MVSINLSVNCQGTIFYEDCGSRLNYKRSTLKSTSLFNKRAYLSPDFLYICRRTSDPLRKNATYLPTVLQSPTGNSQSCNSMLTLQWWTNLVAINGQLTNIYICNVLELFKLFYSANLRTQKKLLPLRWRPFFLLNSGLLTNRPVSTYHWNTSSTAQKL